MEFKIEDLAVLDNLNVLSLDRVNELFYRAIELRLQAIYLRRRCAKYRRRANKLTHLYFINSDIHGLNRGNGTCPSFSQLLKYFKL